MASHSRRPGCCQTGVGAPGCPHVDHIITENMHGRAVPAAKLNAGNGLCTLFPLAPLPCTCTSTLGC